MSFMHIDYRPAVALLKQLMREQLANPNRACVNSEAAFVRSRMEEAGEFYIARQYWNWTCGSRFVAPDVLELFDEEVQDLAQKLRAIDLQTELPDWATRGT